MKRIKQLSIWIIALFAMTVTNPAWAAPKPGCGGEITLTSRTMTSLSISWCKASDNNYPEDRLKYRVVWKKKGSSLELNSGSNGLVNVSSYTIYGLEAGTEYEVYIRVWNPNTDMIHYKTKKFKTDPDKVDPTPGKLSVVGVTKNSIALSWTKATDNSTLQSQLRYQINWKKTTESIYTSSHTVNKLPVDITSYTITGLKPDTEYDVSVYVQDQADNGAWYNDLVVKTHPAVDNQPPTPGSYGTLTSTATTIKVNWTKATDNVTKQQNLRYLVVWAKKMSIVQQSHPDPYTNFPKDQTEYTITGLEPNTEYTVNVGVFDEAGNQMFYGKRTIKTQAVPDYQRPTAGSYGTITATANSIIVNWTRGTDNVTPQNKLRYKVVWKKKSSTMFGNGSILYTDMTSYTLTDLKPDTEYILEVQVWDEANNYKFYGERTVKTKAAGGGSDTQAPTAGSYGTITSTATTITLNWTRGSDNVTPRDKLKYYVAYETKVNYDNGEQLYGTTTKTNITTETLTGLKPNTEYKLEVQVFDEANNFRGYGVRTVKTQAAADTQRPTPGTYSSKPSTATTITLNWTSASDNVTPKEMLKYRIFWKKKSASSWDYTPFLFGTTSYKFTGLEPNTEYEMQMSVWDEAGNRAEYGLTTARTLATTVSVTGVTLSPASLSLEVGQTGGLTATVAPATATNKKVTWSSSNTAVATVDGSGTVKGIAPGTATITVKTVDGGKTATATVTVKAATRPTVKVSNVTLNRNTFTVNGDYEEVQLTATVAPSTATDQSLTWSSDNPQVASVDGNGLVTIHRKGKARITVTANDGSGRYDVCDFDVIMTVGNETVDGLRVYAHGEALYLTLPEASTVHIYHVNGSMVKSLTLPAGDHSEPLTQGFYIVRIGERITKVMVK